MRGKTRHLAHQQKRGEAQLNVLARLNGQRGNLFGVDLWDQFMDAAGDLDAILIELSLP